MLLSSLLLSFIILLICIGSLLIHTNNGHLYYSYGSNIIIFYDGDLDNSKTVKISSANHKKYNNDMIQSSSIQMTSTGYLVVRYYDYTIDHLIEWNGFNRNFISLTLGLIVITIIIVMNEYRHKILKMQALPFDDATNKLRIQELQQFKWDLLIGFIFGYFRGMNIIMIVIILVIIIIIFRIGDLCSSILCCNMWSDWFQFLNSIILSRVITYIITYIRASNS